MANALKQLGFDDDISLVISEVSIDEVYSNKKYIKKRRKNNTLTLKNDVRVEVTNKIEDLKKFHKIMSLNMREYGTPMYPFSYFYYLWIKFHEQGKVILIKGCYGDKMVSGLLLFISGNNAVLKYSAVLRKYISKRLYPTMKWFAMDICKQKNCRILNMGTAFVSDAGWIKF